MQTRRERLFWRVSLLGHVFLAGATLSIALLTVPQERRDGRFWAEALWVTVLIGIRWAYASGYLALAFPRWRAVAGLGGVIPGFGILVTGYTFLSGLLMMVAGWLGPAVITSRIHLAIQIAMFTVVFLLSLSLYLITVLAAPEALPPVGIATPPELAVLVRVQESRLAPWAFPNASTIDPGLRSAYTAFRSLREGLEHTLPASGRFLGEPDYVQLAAEIELLCLDARNEAQLRRGESNRDPLATRAYRLLERVLELAGRLRVG